MTTIQERRQSMLASIARRQRLVNLMIILVLIFTMYIVQIAIDTKVELGSGRIVYWTAGIILILLWVAFSQLPEKVEEGDYYLIHNGSKTDRNSPQDIKLLKAYSRATSRLKLNPSKYNLQVKEGKTYNAFARGLSKGKTICVVTHTVLNTTDEELEELIAHEFGHLINRDGAFTAIRLSLGCGIGLPVTIFSFGIVWSTVGFLNALTLFLATILIAFLASKYIPSLAILTPSLVTMIAVYTLWGELAMWVYYSISSIVIPLISSLASRTTEEFADSFAASYGYGKGLISFFNKLDANRGLEIFSSHPFHTTREKYINKMLRGDEGRISESMERKIWFILKTIIVLILGGYLYLSGLETQSILVFLGMGALFIVSDNLLNSNSGTWHSVFNSNQAKDKISLAKFLKSIFSLGIYLILYLAGLYALWNIKHLEPGLTNLVMISIIGFYLWLAKPLVSIIGIFNDLFSTISDLSTYFVLVISICAMISFFTPIF